MNRESKQHPREPVAPGASFIYDPEASSPVPPDHVTAIPEGDVSSGYTSFLKVERLYAALLSNGLAVFSISLAVLMFVQVILRYGMNSPFVGIEELSLLFAHGSISRQWLTSRARESISTGAFSRLL